MKKLFLTFFLVVFAAVLGVAIASATGDADEPAGDSADVVFLGDLDLAERLEIWRNQYRRMTPGDAPLVQDVGTWPAAWEEFSSVWDTAPAERDLATWLVPFSAERAGNTTVIRDANGTVLWSGTTDFAKDESGNVTLTGDLVDETDCPLYDDAQWEVMRRVGEGHAMRGGIRGTNGPITNGLRFTNVWMETNGDFRMDFAWEEDGDVEVFCRAMHTTSWVETVVWTNDENEVVTNDFTRWRQLDTFHGIPDAWELVGVVAVTNGGGSFTDTNHVPDYDRVRFYAAAKLEDTDGDGMTDGEGWLWNLDSPNTDTDNDGLSDYDERKLHKTDPDNPDSDGDGLGDGYEVTHGTDPLKKDSDQDGLPDGWEVFNGLNPLVATGVNGPDGDLDNDDFSNALEFELSAPANNPAWNGEELAWKLVHYTSSVTTSGGIITTNWHGLRVEVEDSLDCGGTNNGIQNETAVLSVPALLDCGYYIELVVTGCVEDVDANYDVVSFEAAETNVLFSSHDGIPDGQTEVCQMVDESSTSTHLLFGNSDAILRYNTVGHRWHCGGYAEVKSAVCVNPYAVTVTGPDCLRVGDFVLFAAFGGDGGPYTWGIVGDAANVGPEGVVLAVTNGMVTVTATDNSGRCTGTKEVTVGRLELIDVFSDQIPGRDCNVLSAPHPMIMGTRPNNLGYISVAASIYPADCPCPALVGVRNSGTVLACARVQQPRTVLEFTPAGHRKLYDVVGGFDLDGDGTLEDEEITVCTTNTFRMLSQFDYGYSSSLLSGGTVVTIGIASQLLEAFVDDTVPNNALSNATTLASSGLTHPVGAFWSDECTAATRLYLYNAETSVADDVAQDDNVTMAIISNLSSHAEEVAEWFATHQGNSHGFGPWAWHSDGLEFDGLGLRYAFGHVNVTGIVAVTVARTGLSVTRAVYSGAFTDIYDFDYGGAYPSEHAATLQAGYSTLGTGGRVFKVRVEFEHDTTQLNYGFE